MKKERTFLVGLVVLVGCLVFSLLLSPLAAVAADKVYRLKVQSSFPRGDLSMDTLKFFAASAENRSKGRLKISVFAAPEIVAFDQVFDAVKVGTIDIMHGAGTLWGGIIPLGEVEFGIPFAFRIPETKTYRESATALRQFFFNSGFVDLLREEYAKHNIYWVDMHTYGEVPFTLAVKHIKTCQDVKGVKIRDEGVWTVWHNMLGWRGTTSVAPEGTYMGLKLGTLDASQWDVSAVTGLKWHEVAPYWIRGIENDTAVGHIVVNMKVWNSLPEDIKEAFRGAAKDYWYMTLTAYEKEMLIVEGMAKKGIVKESWMDQACIDAHAEAAHKLWDEMASKDAASAKAIQMIRKWRGIK